MPLTEIIDRVSIDGLRFYLTSGLSLERDGNFDYHQLIDTINSNLSNNLGNLFNRLVVLSAKYFGGVLNYEQNGQDVDDEWTKVILNKAFELREQYVESMTRFRHFEALGNVMQFCALLNEYITTKEPWKNIKDPQRKNEVLLVLSNIAEGLRWVANLIYPFTPGIAEKMNNNLFHQNGFELPGSFSRERYEVTNNEILFQRVVGDE